MIERMLTSVLVLTSVLCSPAGYVLDDWRPLPTGTVSRIAFGSCTKQWEPQNGCVASEGQRSLQ
jgi:hypothetical protein